ncbi:MAG TPA: tRNA (N(6)-L-threonylcarbamoyladenosine(37)-C(2))-methylthiotransferase MtaB [Thermoleophilia bacterium]|nr:tRNA (N(6)-L-threonylcarbamoyladenosine(37)-C(2))-methylthiotransferase MtaB [Thermoleophilia bacterium]
MPTVAFHTLGCKLNQCETAQMEEALLKQGFRVVPWNQTAAVRVLNTCTVTSKTDRECRRLIRRAKREDPSSRMVVTGCYAQVAPDRVAAIPEVDLVLGNADKLRLVEHLADLQASPRDGCAAPADSAPRCVTSYASAEDLSGGTEGDFITHFSGYTRAFLKIQNGCDAGCSYCIIPTARGPSRSMPPAQVLEQVQLLGDRGYREVVLTGIHVGAWGRDLDTGDTLADLLTRLPSVESVRRFRLSSIEPMELDERVLRAISAAGLRYAGHFHLPLQSGSDNVLRRMNRPYMAADYLARVRQVRGAFPEAALGADVIVGFPGETEEDFEETCTLVTNSPLTYLHVFAYSDRPGTRASAMKGKVGPEIIHERSRRLRELGDQKNRAFQEAFRGRVLEALVLERQGEDDRLIALTGNYLRVAVPVDRRMINRLVPVKLLEPSGEGWTGKIVE